MRLHHLYSLYLYISPLFPQEASCALAARLLTVLSGFFFTSAYTPKTFDLLSKLFF